MDIQIPAVKPGEKIRAALINRLYELAQRLRIEPAEGVGIDVFETETGTVIALAGARAMWIKLTSNSGANYAWTRQIEASGGGWTAGTQAGTTSADAAVEINGNTSVPANSIVRAWRTAIGDLRFMASSC